MPIEIRNGPRFEWREGMPVSISMTIEVCDADTGAVSFEWRSEAPEVGGRTPPQKLDEHSCVAFSFELPATVQTVTFSVHDAEREDRPALWEHRAYLSLADEKPSLVPPPT